MAAVVLAFQAGAAPHRRTAPIDAADLDGARPGGRRRRRPPGGRRTGRAARPQQRRREPALAPAIAGSSLHVAVGAGGLQRGPAVREFQLKLNAWRSGQGLAPITDDGKWGTDTRTATVAFQAATPGLAPGSGVGDHPDLDRARCHRAHRRRRVPRAPVAGGGRRRHVRHDQRRQGRVALRVGDPGSRHPRHVQGAVHRRRAAVSVVRRTSGTPGTSSRPCAKAATTACSSTSRW